MIAFVTNRGIIQDHKSYSNMKICEGTTSENDRENSNGYISKTVRHGIFQQNTIVI